MYFSPFHTLVGGGQWEAVALVGSSPVCRRLFFSPDVIRGGVEDGGVVAAVTGTASISALLGTSVFTLIVSAPLACD